MSSKQDLIKQIGKMQSNMYRVGWLLAEHEETHYQQHAKELHNAAKMLDDWIEGIQEEVEDEG